VKRRWVVTVLTSVALLYSLGGIAFADTEEPWECFPWPVGCYR